MKGYRLIIFYLLLVLFIALSALCLTGCKSKEGVIENNVDSHKISELFDKMDSIYRTTEMWQMEIWKKQSSLIDSIRQMEKNDSNHVVVVNEKGDTVKERIEIYRYVEKERNTESKENETIINLQSQVDSLVQLSVEQKSLTDSLLKEHGKETVIVKEPTLWERLTENLGDKIMMVLILVVLLILLRKQK